MLFHSCIRMKIINLVPPKFGASCCQFVGSISCMFSILLKERQEKQENAREKLQEFPGCADQQS